MPDRTPPRRRTLAVTAVALGAVAVTVAGTTTAGATPAGKATHPTRDRAAAAAGFLASHLRGAHHDHLTVTFSGTTYPDYGTTADAVLSMDAAGVAQRAAARATSWLAAHAAAYAGSGTSVYPGSAAKLLLVALAQHRNVHDFGGLDLVQAIAGTEHTTGADRGEYEQNPNPDPSFPTPSSYVVSQALPVLALAAAPQPGAEPSAAAVAFLAGQQCDNGSFASVIRDDTSTPCADNDVDSTGYAAQALLAAGADDAAATALDWLAAARNDDGGWGEPASNANSTALAVQALVAGHRTSRPGVRWLRHHQIRCSGAPARRGAVTFQDTYSGAALRATAQAGAALASRPLASIDKAGATYATPTLAC